MDGLPLVQPRLKALVRIDHDRGAWRWSYLGPPDEAHCPIYVYGISSSPNILYTIMKGPLAP